MVEKRKAPTLVESIRTKKARNDEAVRLALEIRNKRKRNATEAQLRRNMEALERNAKRMQPAMQPRVREMLKERAKLAYVRVLDKVMRQTAYTATDCKYLGKITKAYRDQKWSALSEFIKEWERALKRRVCAMKKTDMQRIARGMNIDVAQTNVRKTICAKIKNKL